MQDLKLIKISLKKAANQEKAFVLGRFFKTKPGEYGEGDVFIGVVMPDIRKIAKQYYIDISLNDAEQLLHSRIHEERMTALIILINKYKEALEKDKEKIFELYLSNTQYINNWDLVDVTAEHIVGAWLADKSKDVLFKLAKSNDLWEKRIAMISTFYYIKRGECDNAIKIAEILLCDDHDLIHKVVGWMLREVGNHCSIMEEEKFLKKHYKSMPRTMLRYAIEKFPESRRQKYLKNQI